MSAPTPAPGDDRPRPAYYPDPSIPGYIRYWNGASWVPGTSRPAPAAGEPLPAPPPGSVPATPAPAEETGPVFLDEDPAAPSAEGPARDSAWGADPARQSGFGGAPDHRVSWGGPEPAVPDPRTGEAAAPAKPVEGTLTFRRPSGPVAPAARRETAGPSGLAQSPVDPRGTSAPATPTTPPRARTPAPCRSAPCPAPRPGHRTARRPAVPQPRPAPAPAPVQQPAPVQPGWAQQLPAPAAPAAPAVPVAPARGDENVPVVPWKPPVEDPFLAAARAQAAARPAGLGRRLAARLVDTLVVGAVTAAAAVPLASAARDHLDAKIEAAKLSGRTVTVWLLDGTTAGYLAAVLAVLLLFGVVYEALPTAKWGRTLGKKLFGLRVQDIEEHDAPAFGAALRRWLVYSVSGLLVVGVAGVLWCLFDRPWRQCWHDKAARTFVAR
ncbi:RDD family protein [Streptomyces albidoflavus]|uniref:RDD family protein n=1 Tax=Streptomyces albidoflavus TaxID=1886 RepID=UPI00226F4BF7|nr:RDD family protein [Streptomyces albidoflavus]CAI4173215.1 RDD domain-containing protein [Streptomyces albidoflavus]